MTGIVIAGTTRIVAIIIGVTVMRVTVLGMIIGVIAMADIAIAMTTGVIDTPVTVIGIGTASEIATRVRTSKRPYMPRAGIAFLPAQMFFPGRGGSSRLREAAPSPVSIYRGDSPRLRHGDNRFQRFACLKIMTACSL
jgi:hypothetical protein